MNKKLLAAAVAAAVVASPAAFAESTVYGKMHASIDAIDYETSNEDNYEVNSRASRLGFKGSEDLGNGLKAIYQIELGIDINSSGADGQGSGSNGFWGSKTRNTFVGLSGDWGTFLIGRHDTPAKMAFYAAGNDRLGDSVIDLNLGNNLTGAASTNAPIGVFHEYRADDVIAYVSPNFSGFTVAGAIIPGEDNKATTAQTFGSERDGIADHYSVGAMYKGNGLKASVGYASYDLDGPSTVNNNLDDYEVMQAGASYTMNNFSIGAQYEDSENPGGTKADYTAWAVTGKYTFGNNAIIAVYTDAEYEPSSSVCTSCDEDRSGWGLAAEHNFSKRTKVYAAYASGENEYDDPNDSDEDDDVFSLGMIHNF
jgi:predicted porin